METKETVLLDVRGMRCAGCVGQVERALRSVGGVADASVNLATGEAVVSGVIEDLGDLETAIEQVGFRAAVHSTASPASRLAQMESQLADEEKSLRGRVALSAVVVVLLAFAHFLLPHREGNLVSVVLAVVLQFTVGLPYYRGAWHRLRFGSADMDTLVALGTTAALGYSLFMTFHDPHGASYAHDSVMVLALVTVGKWLEGRSRADAGRAIRELLKLAPAQAIRLVGDEQQTVPAEELRVRDIVLIRPGESVPVDGTIIHGSSSLNEASLTGESVPVDRTVGERVQAGTLNLTGPLHVRAGRVGGDTGFSGIVRLLDQAQSSKPQLARLADTVAQYFVPAVLLLALVTLVAHGAVGMGWESGLRAAVCVLVVACPCAMGLATPTAIMVATGMAAKWGLYFRRASALEQGEKISIVALDKTGTVTEGRPSVVSVEPADGWSESELLRLAGAVEQVSRHPWAQSIVQEAKRQSIQLDSPSEGKEIAGSGVEGKVGGLLVRAGKRRWLESLGVAVFLDSRGGGSATAEVYVSVDARYVGRFGLADQIKSTSKSAIDRLRDRRIEVHLLTGDVEAVARQVASEVGIPPEHLHAEMTPASKERFVREREDAGQRVAMVGDGINDAPSLAAATLGIAMGEGTDVAKEAGDVVIAGSSLELVPQALDLCRATVRKIKQNLFWAFGYNVVLLPLAALGYLSPSLSALAMAASSVSVVTNSLLLRRQRAS